MKARRVLYWIILLVVTVNLAIIAVVLLGDTTPPPKPLPNPNGYDDFVKAGAMLSGDPSNYRTFSEATLRDFVQTNAGAFKLLHLGLTRECRVPAVTPTNLTVHFNELGRNKNLAFALMAEARLAELEHRTNDALRIDLDAERFSHEAARGGVMIDSLSAMACENTSLGALSRLSRELNAVQLREAAGALSDIDASSDTAQEVLDQEKAFSHKFGMMQRLAGFLSSAQQKASIRNFLTKFHGAEKNRRRLILTLASRAYSLEHGGAPNSTSDIVPAYLKSIPQDPLTGTNMILNP
jgi:hypothetical protein